MTPFLYASLILLLFIPGRAASMEIFQYVDSSGTVHFTNVPTDPRYRRLKPNSKSILKEKESRRKLHLFIEKEALVQGVEPALVKAVIRAESDFDAEAVSSAGAQGLMQLMPATAADLQMGDPFDPEENVKGGVRYLRILLDLFENDLVLALAAYHAGPGNVQKYGTVPPIEATHTYIARVLRFYRDYLGKTGRSPSIHQVAGPSRELVYTDRPERHPQLSLSQLGR